MPRSIVVGEQDFAMLRTEDCFYVDKTHFIGEWWRSKNRVTLITRPRRFGKSLMLDTLERFFHERNGAPARGAPCIENMH